MFALNLHAALHSFGYLKVVFRCGCCTTYLLEQPVDWHFCAGHGHWRYIFLNHQGMPHRGTALTSPN